MSWDLVMKIALLIFFTACCIQNLIGTWKKESK